MVPPVPIASFHSVSKTYPGQPPALRSLDLDIARGEFLTLLGPSGSGKTTTLMLLAGFETQDEGEIELEGRSVGATPPWRRGLGMVFQHYALFPHMSVAQNIAFPLAARGISRAQRAIRVAEALAMVRLEGLGDRRPAQLSGGQQQRVALARALVFGPALVLLDEPLAALDRALREELQAELRALHRRLGVSMLYVTHDQAEALALSDRIAVLRQGRIEQLDTPARLYERPANSFVAGFMGENNRLPGRFLGLEDSIARVRLDDGPDVAAEPAAELAPGDACVVMIRPERIALAAAAAADLGGNAIAATLIEVVFAGDHLRLLLALVGGSGRPGASILVRRPAAAGLSGLAPGQEAALAWQPEHAMMFAAGS